MNFDQFNEKSKLIINESQKKAIQKYDSFVIVDDIIATGGTVKCLSDLISSQNKEVTGLNVVVELRELKGRDKFQFPVASQLTY